MSDERMTDEEFRAFMRAQVRRDGAGPVPGYWTEAGERFSLEAGESMRDAMRDHPSPVVAYVAAVGEEFDQATCFDAPMDPGLCYYNARRIAKEMRRDGWRYVEGWPRHTILGDTLVRHAWCVDDCGWAVEVTWDDPSTFYLGVAFDKIPPKREGNIAITDEWALKQLAKMQPATEGHSAPEGVRMGQEVVSDGHPGT